MIKCVSHVHEPLAGTTMLYCIVFLGLQDVGFDFMCDPRFPKDTLFITFEQDFRWYERDCMSVADWLPMCVNMEGSQIPGVPPPPPPPPQSPPGQAEPLASSSGAPEPREIIAEDGRGASERVLQATKPVGLDPVFSRELFDLVSTCNIAMRQGLGEVVWFGYNVTDKKNSPKKGCVGFGSQGVAFTQSSARVLKQLMEGRTPRLFDMWLKDQLTTDYSHPEQAWCRNMQHACYISPPLGGFYEHETEIVGVGKTRPGLWGALWGQEGSVGAVRPTDRPRELKTWVCGGNREAEGLTVYRLPPLFNSEATHHFWKTMMPPPSDERSDVVFVEILRKLGYMSVSDGTYWGPPLLHSEGWKQKKNGEWQWVEDPHLHKLRWAPDESEKDPPGSKKFLSRLGMKVVAYDPEHPPDTNRDRRRMRTWTTWHGYRKLVQWQPMMEVARGHVRVILQKLAFVS